MNKDCSYCQCDNADYNFQVYDVKIPMCKECYYLWEYYRDFIESHDAINNLAKRFRYLNEKEKYL